MPSKTPPNPPPGPVASPPGEDDLRRLVAAARTARDRAHAPYSGLRVGAALLDRAGTVYVGCNVENASYGLTLCAERNAAARAVVEGARELLVVAIVSTRSEPLLPCGACRQVLSEIAPGAWVACVGESGARVLRRLDELLPDAFGPADLPPQGD